MPKEKGSEITTFEQSNKKLTYANDFRILLKENPGILRTASDLMEKAKQEYNPKEFRIGGSGFFIKYDKESNKWLEGVPKYLLDENYQPILDQNGAEQIIDIKYKSLNLGRNTMLAAASPVYDEKTNLEVTMFGSSNRHLKSRGRERIDICEYFKLTKDGETFFVKKSYITTNPGYTEFRNIQEAKKLLADLDFIKVVDAQLGYQDKNISWYVSKWEDLEKVGFGPSGMLGLFDDYGNSFEDKEFGPKGFKTQEDLDQFEKKIQLIKERLVKSGLDRDLDANLFYNYKTKTFILLDVTGGDGETLGNPHKKIP